MVWVAAQLAEARYPVEVLAGVLLAEELEQRPVVQAAKRYPVVQAGMPVAVGLPAAVEQQVVVWLALLPVVFQLGE